MGKLIDITEASTLMGVNPKTLRRWDDEGEFRPQYRTADGHRRYNTKELEKGRYENSEGDNTGTID